MAAVVISIKYYIKSIKKANGLKSQKQKSRK